MYLQKYITGALWFVLCCVGVMQHCLQGRSPICCSPVPGLCCFASQWQRGHGLGYPGGWDMAPAALAHVRRARTAVVFHV